MWRCNVVLHGEGVMVAMEVANRYTRTAMVLHWLVALLIVANVAMILVVDLLPDSMVRPVIDLHKSIGLTVLGLVLLRVLWRLSHRPPALPRSYPWLERVGAHTAHGLLYLLILGLPISGWIHDSAFKDAAAHPLTLFGVIPWFRIGPIMALDPATKEQVHAFWFSVHASLAYALYVILALHILGALKHQFIDKKAEFGRILPWGRADL
jgi:cytochrome b561